MSASLAVTAPGLHTTIQDLGRNGYRSLGVPSSGPLDRIAITLANALVRNPPGTPALEILMCGPTLKVHAPSVRVALVGGRTSLMVSGRSVPSGQSVRVCDGESLAVGSLQGALCGYLAVEGGFDASSCLGSVATYTRGRIGGLQGRALKSDDVLTLRCDSASPHAEQMIGQPYFGSHATVELRVVLGPQDDHFTTRSVETFLSAEYSISGKSDRMAFRLDGPPLEHSAGFNIVSDGVLPGSIQVLGTGQPIVLMADAHTMGGYPKIATVISADLPLLGRSMFGTRVRFSAVTQAQAEVARRDQEQTIVEIVKNFQAVPWNAQVDTAALHSHNLIDGVVDAVAWGADYAGARRAG